MPSYSHSEGIGDPDHQICTWAPLTLVHYLLVVLEVLEV